MKKFLSLFALSMEIFVAVGCGGNKNVNDEPVATVMPREHLEHWESWTEDSFKMVNNATVQEFDGTLIYCEYPEGWTVWLNDSLKMVNTSKKNPNGPSSDILIKSEIDSFETAEESVGSLH
ncbi:MAG: hypothetical protein KAH01_01710 [Caldisericia bacterium]|nr:hypothetical protein [Caldisericia bacterium]